VIGAVVQDRKASARWQPRMVGGSDHAAAGDRSQTVAILLSVYNGEAYLNQQLDSFLGQTHDDWILYWRDDGSTDASRAIMLSFEANRGRGRCVEVTSIEGRLGIAGSYWLLLSEIPEYQAIAFSDQDDVWLPEKLAWGVAALRARGRRPALYCARQYLTDSDLRVTGRSQPLHHAPSFLSALTQNVATGHTIMLNSQAHAALREFAPPASVLHDWWSYLVVSGAGGDVIFDDRCVTYYRQHRRNAIGARSSLVLRGLAALQRGPRVFMTIFAANVARLSSRPERLSVDNRAVLRRLAQALRAGRLSRLKLLRALPGMVRQSAWETLIFRLWFLR
jgi:glycosyltransferase involved in cell wall biosynthesis